MVSGNAFDLLGIQPYRGRLIAPYDDVRGGPRGGWPVVLSYGFWSDFYGRATDIVGKQIKISDVPVTVVGITPPDFHGVWPGEEPKMYLPFQFASVLANKNVLDDPDSAFGGSVIGRLKQGVSLAQANAELAHLQKSLFDRFIPPRYQHDPYVEKAYLKASSAQWIADVRKPDLRQAFVFDARAGGSRVGAVLRQHWRPNGVAYRRPAAGVCGAHSGRGLLDAVGASVFDREFCNRPRR
jgi:MacB-like periplasmic core domain